jgi:hypothetical protein
MLMYHVLACGSSLLKMFRLEETATAGGTTTVSAVLATSASSFDTGAACEAAAETSEGTSDLVLHRGLALLADRAATEEAAARSASGCGCGGVVVMGLARSTGGAGSATGACAEHFGCFCVGG